MGEDERGAGEAALRDDEAEAALAESERRYRLIAENTVEVISLLDLSLRYTWVSPSILRTKGLTVEEALGRTLERTLAPASLELVSRIFAEEMALEAAGTADPDRSRTLELEEYRKDGSTIWVEDTLSFVRDEQGRATGVLSVSRDITARKRAAAERASLEEQLRLARRLEAIGRLAGGVAHDFNNLLSAILAYSGFALDALHESDPVRADVLEVQRAAERAAALTRQLLAFGRKQMLAPRALSLERLVEGLEPMLRRLLGEDVEIVVRLAEELVAVEADPGQIEQVIVNLAVNARDAMPAGGTLTIETAVVELDDGYAARHVGVRPGPYVMLAVSDTGVGMDTETLERAFEPFFTTKEKDRGTGLGLATVYGIVKQSGGNVWAYSEPGIGSTFKVYLPRTELPAELPARTPSDVPSTGGETVLVVEDEGAVRRVAERILRAAGYRVLTATGGGEALLLIEERSGGIDLLLTDVVMPRIGGGELAERLARLCPGLKVLFMSGYTDNAIVHHGVLEPGTHFLAKPFTAAALVRKVREVLDGP